MLAAGGFGAGLDDDSLVSFGFVTVVPPELSGAAVDGESDGGSEKETALDAVFLI